MPNYDSIPHKQLSPSPKRKREPRVIDHNKYNYYQVPLSLENQRRKDDGETERSHSLMWVRKPAGKPEKRPGNIPQKARTAALDSFLRSFPQAQPPNPRRKTPTTTIKTAYKYNNFDQVTQRPTSAINKDFNIRKDAMSQYLEQQMWNKLNLGIYAERNPHYLTQKKPE